MSETVLHVGKLHKLWKISNKETLNQQIKRVLLYEGIKEDELPTEEYQLLPLLLDHTENKYIVYKDDLYIIDDKEKDESEDIIEAKIIDSSTIEYILKYYNGVSGFYGCLTEAVENLK